MRKIFLLTFFVAIFISGALNAQNVAINTTGASADNSAMLDIKSENKGVLIPRVSTAARNTIASPAAGLIVYDTTESTLYMFDGMRWLGFQAMPDNLRPISKMLFGPDQQDTLFAGYSVSISDEFAAIGAPYRNQPQILSGGVYIYRRTGDNWNYFTTLSPHTGLLDTAAFGTTVNLSGNHLIVSAPHKKNASGVHVGAAYIFSFNGTAWVSSGLLWGTTEGNGFATQVDINDAGNYAAVTEPGATAGGFAGAGVIRVYNKLVSWVLQTSLSDPAPHAGEGLGESMAMSPAGTYIIAGAPRKTVLGQTNSGVATLFSRSGSVWSHMNTFINGGAAGVFTGQLVDVTNTKVLVVDGATRTVKYFNIGLPWSTFPYVYTAPIEGVKIDPVTEEFYVWIPPYVYKNGDKVKTLSMTEGGYSFPNLFSMYNKRFVVGRPGESPLGGTYVGGFMFGSVVW